MPTYVHCIHTGWHLYGRHEQVPHRKHKFHRVKFFIKVERSVTRLVAAAPDVWDIIYVLFQFGFCTVFEKTRIRFGMSLVQFDLKKTRFGSDVIAIYYLCEGKGNLRPRRPPREYLGEYTS